MPNIVLVSFYKTKTKMVQQVFHFPRITPGKCSLSDKPYCL